MDQLLLSDFMSLFSGNIHNYGQHEYNFTESGKESGKNYTITNELLTEKQYKNHLEGRKGLGVIPINEDNKCKFIAIDIDVYNFSLDKYIKAIERNSFPFVPFKSKSGGLHLFLFLKELEDVKKIKDQVQKLITYLGIDILIKNKLNKLIEIFPKQIKLQKGAIGNWINLPYYNCGDTKQYALRNGKQLKFIDALTYCKEKVTTLNDLKNFTDDIPFQNGPPCLQSIYLLNPIGENEGRNNYLFSFAVYFKKVDENFFEQKVFEINSSLQVPLSIDELEKTVLQSVRKKDYIYKCYEHPCIDFCNKGICKTRTFGIGKEGGYFSGLEYGILYQIKTALPYYEWEIKKQGNGEFTKLRFKNEDEIIKQDTFLKLCLRKLHVLPIKMKQAEWFKIVNQYLKEIKVIEIDIEDDLSSYSLFKSLFFDFLLNRAKAETKDQIFMKRVYFDPKTEDYYFRGKDLLEYFYINKNFKYFNPTEIFGILQDYKIKTKKIKTETRKQVRVFVISKEYVEEKIDIVEPEFIANFENKEEAF